MGKLPVSNHTHPIHTQLRGLLSDKIPSDELIKHLQYFVLSNFRGPEFVSTRYKHAQEIVDTFTWPEKFEKIITNA